MHVGGARDVADAARKLLRDAITRGGIAAHHLQVDGRGDAEIQNLVGDVGGFPEERDVGKLLVQVLAQAVRVFGDGSVILRLERNQDIAVIRTDVGAVAVRQADAAEGDADVIQDGIDLRGRNHAPDFGLDIGEAHLALLYPRAHRQAGVQAHLSGIDRGKEIAADERDQRHRADHEDTETGQHQGAVIERPVQQPRIR